MREISKVRGVFEKLPGSGVWWIRYADSMGKAHREKAGAKNVAIALYQKRKTGILLGEKLPEKLRRKRSASMILLRMLWIGARLTRSRTRTMKSE